MGELRKRGGVWWIRYYRNGQRFEESSGSSKKRVAVDLLKTKEGDIVHGLPVSPKIGRLWFDEAAEDLLNDYRINRKKSVDEVERRIDKHLRPFFGPRRMATITPADIRSFIAKRQADTIVTTKAREIKLKDGTVRRIPERTREIDGVSNAEINRELTTLKRMFTLGMQSGKLLHKPHIPLLREDNTRTGFFEPEQFASVYAHLPESLKPIIEFAYITGWRIVSEVLLLEWRQVDLEAGEVRLDPGTTKNGEGRVFPFTDDLRRLLEEQHAEHVKLRRSGKVEPHVFFRMVAKGRRGTKAPRPIRSLNKAFDAAASLLDVPDASPTISAGPLFGTWFDEAFRSASRWS